ncbi:MAG: transposase [Phycisphaerales bacterium]
MSEPIAYFITWTCRGAWLHGDLRGSFQRITGAKRAEALAPDPQLRERQRESLKHDVIVLNASSRRLVESALREACEHRSWILHALDVRSNHVHVVVSSPGCTPERAMQQLKSRATGALRDDGVLARDQQPWTRHGSTRYLWKHEDFAGAVEYVNDWQDRSRE